MVASFIFHRVVARMPSTSLLLLLNISGWQVSLLELVWLIFHMDSLLHWCFKCSLRRLLFIFYIINLYAKIWSLSTAISQTLHFLFSSMYFSNWLTAIRDVLGSRYLSFLFIFTFGSQRVQTIPPVFLTLLNVITSVVISCTELLTLLFSYYSFDFFRVDIIDYRSSFTCLIT